MAKNQELKFTGGWDQDELQNWWTEVGYPGQAPAIPESLVGKMLGRGRDAAGIYDIVNGKANTKSRRVVTGDEQDFRNSIGKFTDPFRQQSGISKIAGGVLSLANVLVPGMSMATKLTNAGNMALANPKGDMKSMIKTMVKANDGSSPAATAGTAVAPLSYAARERTPVPTDLLHYGEGPEHSFFKPKVAPPVGVAPPAGLAHGGKPSMLKHYPLRPRRTPTQELRNFGSLDRVRGDPRVRIALGDRGVMHRVAKAMGGFMDGGGTLSQEYGPAYVSQGTAAGGREDNIDAKLSENEYVIDAETVALLGDGNPEAGAKKLDSMRENIRRHKGGALAKGEISPDAHGGALQYLSGGGKVRPRQSLSQAMDEQDRDFDRFRASAPRGLRRTRARPGNYEERSRVRVGDTSYDIEKPQRVVRKAEGGKVKTLKGVLEALREGAASTGVKRRMKSLSRQESRELMRNNRFYVDLYGPMGGRKKGAQARVRDDIEDAMLDGGGQKPTSVYAEGGKVSILKSLFKKKEDPNARLRGVLDTLNASLKRPDRVDPTLKASQAELDADVAKLRREVGAQGGDTRPLTRKCGGGMISYRGGK